MNISAHKLLKDKAHAKLNLNLHVLTRRADGYHELESLVAFADLCDFLSLRVGQGFSLEIKGPWASALQGRNNILEKANEVFCARFKGALSGVFTLTKFIPVEAGLGGGSADAAAALRLLARANGIAEDAVELYELAQDLGADVSVCLRQKSCVMRGIGHELGAALDLPPFHVVLANPRKGVATKGVFEALGLKVGQQRNGALQPPPQACDAQNWLAYLQATQNDLTRAAHAQCNDILPLIATLQENGALVSHMSGSGATVFGLFETCTAAMQAQKALRKSFPKFWVKQTQLLV